MTKRHTKELIDTWTTQFGLQQIIKELTHILAESFSCIDLIFTSHQYLKMEYGGHSSLYPNRHTTSFQSL